MIAKNATVGSTENVTVAEFGHGSIQVMNAVYDDGKMLILRQEEPHDIGLPDDSTNGKTLDEIKPDIILDFKNKASFDVFYEFVEKIRLEFERQK